MAKRMIALDYSAVRKAFDEEYKATRKLIESGETHLDNLAEGFTEADRVLRKMPTVDAIEVVRCKNCKHCRINEFAEMSGMGFCRLTESGVRQDDFCSYGERKEKDD